MDKVEIQMWGWLLTGPQVSHSYESVIAWLTCNLYLFSKCRYLLWYSVMWFCKQSFFFLFISRTIIQCSQCKYSFDVAISLLPLIFFFFYYYYFSLVNWMFVILNLIWLINMYKIHKIVICCISFSNYHHFIYNIACR